MSLRSIVDVTLRNHRILYFNDTFFVINGLIYTEVHHTKACFFKKDKHEYPR